ncbi:MAG TPA: hypothetical protein VKP65_19960, partial [Rhodothermales bacterium]|nr:hypothetical protein [Rhodothermales bacterium]
GISGNLGYFSDLFSGAYGRNSNGHEGYLGTDNFGVRGVHGNGHVGTLGNGGSGVRGEHTNGHFGYLGGSGAGAYGESSSGNRGWLGSASSGAYGEHTNGHFGRLGDASYGAYGEHDNGHVGRLGGASYGVYGENTGGEFGYLGSQNAGAYGEAPGGAWGALGYGVYAGFFDGDVTISGHLDKGGGSFKIDHPLDPANRYLAHSFVESPDMMNVYNGNVTTDAQGLATVILPEYFEVLNRDFRYQLTVIGTFAQAIIADKMRGNRFVIRTDQPGVEVSWQVTGIRQDRWANENRIIVEEDKPAEERGYYLHPKLYGQPEERSIQWARDPEGMRARREMPQRREQERQQMEEERERMNTEQEPGLSRRRPGEGQ